MPDDPDSRSVVSISNRQARPVDEAALTRLARQTLAAEGRERVELSVSLVSVDEMADLHQRYLGEAGPTDVLAFPQDDDRGEDDLLLLGDVVICPDVAAERRGGESEIGLLLVHGILHLLGYDHETDEDRAVMWGRQAAYSGVTMDEEGSP